MTLIRRDGAIPGAANDNFHPDGDVHCADAQPAVTPTVALSNAQVRALNGTPIDLAAPPVGRSVYPVGVYFRKRNGGYTLGADVTIHFKDGADTQVATIPVASMRNTGSAAGWATRTPLTGNPAAQVAPREGLDVRTATAFTGSSGGELLLDLVHVELA